MCAIRRTLSAGQQNENMLATKMSQVRTAVAKSGRTGDASLCEIEEWGAVVNRRMAHLSSIPTRDLLSGRCFHLARPAGCGNVSHYRRTDVFDNLPANGEEKQ